MAQASGLQSIRTGAPVENAAISKRSREREGMQRNIFILSFFLSIAGFAAFWIFAHDSYLYVPFMHIGMLSLALFFIWDKTLSSTAKKLGIPGDWKSNAKYCVIGAVMIMLAILLLNIAVYIGGIKDDADRVGLIVAQLPWYILLFGITAAPIIEEIFFRGFLAEKIGMVPSSLLFGLAHFAYGSITQLAGTFLIGLIMAYIYKKGRSVVPCMALHGLFNLAAILTMSLGG